MELWKVEYEYDNGLSCEEEYKDHNTLYLNGTRDQVCEWIMNTISFGNTELVDLTFKRRYKIKTEYTEIDNKIVGVQEMYNDCTYVWETHTYTATPTTLDKIIINL